ncbi:hypothetical protein MUU72_24385 [Streptomyces sp. RS10V-4]|uniref:hypothetical protein n=1 Tax=Streptomyces rhizoryzae TaxID=2932493 RepID=UPI002005A57F|nr:hypothetical protein [Streptomyces rhizoryzae]MCK7626206.1 hypothetical protein [Streptomyces rhizoryzae]
MSGLSGPVHLADPLAVAEPEPVAGCDVCGALARQRARARAAGDRSKATDCTVEMRRHPHRKATS